MTRALGECYFAIGAALLPLSTVTYATYTLLGDGLGCTVILILTLTTLSLALTLSLSLNLSLNLA